MRAIKISLVPQDLFLTYSNSVSKTGKIPNANSVVISQLFANSKNFKAEKLTVNCLLNLMLPRILLLSDIG